MVLRKGADVPQTLKVSFADGSSKTVKFDGPRAWQRFTWETASKAVSAQLDPDNRIYLDANKLDDGRTLKADASATRTFGWQPARALPILLRPAGECMNMSNHTLAKPRGGLSALMAALAAGLRWRVLLWWVIALAVPALIALLPIWTSLQSQFAYSPRSAEIAAMDDLPLMIEGPARHERATQGHHPRRHGRHRDHPAAVTLADRHGGGIDPRTALPGHGRTGAWRA
jgi:hypothetical protein